MPRPRRSRKAIRRLEFAFCCGAAIFVASGASARATAGPVALRISGAAFGEALELEVLDLPRAQGEAALTKGWDAVVLAERALERLVARPAGESAPLSAELWRLLSRARDFCNWSDGASGPVGGAVYRLWADGAREGSLPTPDRLDDAARTTKCARLTLRTESQELSLADGSSLDLRGFALGWAVDLAVETLRAEGAANLRVTLGPVTRAAGRGPGGQGWPLTLPALSPSGKAQSQVLLVDQALAIADPGKAAFTVGGERILPAFDLRSGHPATGVASVVAVTELAADAEPLAWSMVVLGASGGQLRLGSLRPKPSVLWLLGSGDAAVVSSSNWSAVKKP